MAGGVDFNAFFSGSAEKMNASLQETPSGLNAELGETGGAASDYNVLQNKPRINGVELTGDVDLEALGAIPDRTFVYAQASAADVWTIKHNLGKRPAVMIVDSAGTAVIGEVEYLDDNTVRVSFSAAFSGKAYMN